MNSKPSFLIEEYLKRVKKSPRYSMRAFANFLNINIGTLSSIFTGRRPLTREMGERICLRLGYSPEQMTKALANMQSDRRRTKKVSPSTELIAKNEIELEQEVFLTISDWYHYAILQIIRTDSYLEDPSHSKPSWIAKQLGISTNEAKFAIQRLESLGLIKRSEDGFFIRGKESITTKNKNLTNPALINWQKQIRERAIQSLVSDPIEKRSMTSMTMAIDPAKLGQAKVLVEKFQNEMANLLERESKKEVYQLSVSLFPIKGDLK